VSRRDGTRGIRFHQESRAAARDVRDYSGASMELGDRAQIDGEGELNLLSLA
jgi:hypothetical protein